MNQRIRQCFKSGKKQLVGYVTVGCPDLAASEQYILDLLAGGVDIIELGVPFSDPTADGEVIQLAGNIALQNKVKFADVIKVAASVRAKFPQVPIILFSYYNVLLNYGLERLKTLDVDGILAVDLPLEERAELEQALAGSTIEIIPLISPATGPERVKAICRGCDGFVYYITVRGVTGVRHALPEDLKEKLVNLKSIVSLPVAAGFGIAGAAMAAEAAKFADAIVIGSALVKSAIDRDFAAGVKLVKDVSAAIR